MLSLINHIGYDCHRGCAAPDHCDFLAGIVEIFWPFLRMNELALKVREPCEIGRISLRIIIIATAHEEYA